MTDLIEGTLEKARAAIATHDLAVPDAAVLLMVSGGSDSTALAYLGAALREAGDVASYEKNLKAVVEYAMKAKMFRSRYGFAIREV